MQKSERPQPINLFQQVKNDLSGIKVESDKYRSAYNNYTKKLIQSFTLTINKSTLTKGSGLNKNLFFLCVWRGWRAMSTIFINKYFVKCLTSRVMWVKIYFMKWGLNIKSLSRATFPKCSEFPHPLFSRLSRLAWRLLDLS